MDARFKWDIFCRVVDNFGDAGVCWRLARQLVAEEGAAVRLWIDDLASLERLVPEVSTAADAQIIDGVHVRRWYAAIPRADPARVVVEAFGCGIPDEYVAAMARAKPPSLWIVLEYLSAEPWVPEHHALPSPHPKWPLERHFFFPGFVEGTGGLLLEHDLFERRDRFGASDRELAWQRLGHAPAEPGATAISLFAYESAPLHAMLDAWVKVAAPVVVAVPQGRVLNVVLEYFREGEGARVLRRGALEARVVPFTSQACYDDLLWTCDLNFVRGEDSFVRAQWAARPFVWHIYPQKEGAHTRKLRAFLDLYGEGLPPRARTAVSDLMRLWNREEVAGVTLADAWAAFAAAQATLRSHGASWAAQVAEVGGLARNLAQFCSGRLK